RKPQTGRKGKKPGPWVSCPRLLWPSLSLRGQDTGTRPGNETSAGQPAPVVNPDSVVIYGNAGRYQVPNTSQAFPSTLWSSDPISLHLPFPAATGATSLRVRLVVVLPPRAPSEQGLPSEWKYSVALGLGWIVRPNADRSLVES